MTAAYPVRYHPFNGVFGACWHMDWSVADPLFLVANTTSHLGPDYLIDAGYSVDGGYHWTKFPTMPGGATNGLADFGFGSIHVGSPDNIIWVSSYSHGAYRTTNKGTSWSALSIPGVTMSSLNIRQHYYYRRPITAEKTYAAADTFYAHAPDDGVYRSVDGGATWTQRCDTTPFTGTDWSQHAYLKAVPWHAGHLFDTPGWQGPLSNPPLDLPFMRSVDGGATWTQVPGLTSVRGFDFGVPAAGYTYPAIYAVGVVGGVIGVYLSLDNAATWLLLSAQPNGTVDFVRNVAASKQVYGKHWLTTAGSGLIVGELT